MPLNSVKVYKKKSLVIFDEKRKQIIKLKDFNEDSEEHSPSLNSLQSAIALSDLESKSSEEYVDKCPTNRLFVGIININKCEEDARVLYNKLLKEDDSFKTVFWRDVRPAEVERNLFNLSSTIEELNEA